MKKVIGLILVFVLAFTAFVGCGNDSTEGEGGEAEGASGAITVVTREEGSGTRDGFTELMGIKVDDVDNTTQTAEVSNSTSVVMTTVAGNVNAIGYISLGSLNDTIKAVSVDGVEANVDNILSGEYPIYRPFNIVTNSNNDLSALAQDFITFIMSKQGQDIITEEGYISEAESPAEYTQQEGLSGKIVCAGSTSVSPVMEVLADAYKEMYPDVEIEIQQTGSGAGITSTIEGACDIGMASREIKDEELAEGLEPTKIALDGIAVVVNNDNSVTNLTSEQIKAIFTGETTDWADVAAE